MGPAALVLPGVLVGAAVGVLIADPAGPPPGFLSVLQAASIATAVLGGAVLLAGRRWRLRGAGRAGALLAAVGLGLALGAWRGAATALPTGPGTLSALVRDGAGERQVAGTVVDDPRPREDRQQLVLDALVVDGRPLQGRLVAWLPRALPIGNGDRVAFGARLDQPQDFDGFAYRAYLARQGIGAVARAYDATVARPAGTSPVAALAGARSALLAGLDRLVPEPEAALGAGILLGVRTAIDPSINDAFAAAGLTHVVAISGWNIAIVAALVARLLEGLRGRGGPLVPLLTLAAIAGYVALVGSSPSVVRAALMAGAMLFGRQAGTRAHGASALMLAGLVMLVAAPSVLWDVGFQLSFLATAGLIAFGAAFEARLAAWPAWVREPVALTLAAQLTTLPVILLTFERLSLVAPLANVLVTPLVPLVMLACAVAAPVGVLLGVLHPPVLGDAAAWLAGGAAWLGLRAMIVMGGALGALPFAALPVSLPPLLAAAWYPFLAVAWRRRARSAAPDGGPVAIGPPSRRRRLLRAAGRGLGRLLAPLRRGLVLVSTPRRALAGLVVLLAATTVATQPDGRLHVVMLDIGQGDAILVTAPSGATLLVDGGPDPDVTLRRLGAALPWWQRRIDVVLLTHPHQDHVGGLPEVLRRYAVNTVLDGGRAYGNPAYASLLALAATEPGTRLHRARAGDVVTLDRRTALSILYPSEADAGAPLPAGDLNNASVVGLLRLDRFSALLTGDAEAPVEAMLAGRDLLTPVDVLKVGHHGSKSGTTPGFLSGVDPAVGLVSVGTGNEYGHPSPQTLQVLADAGVTVYRTDLDGTTEVRTDGASWSVHARGRTGPVRAARGAGATALRAAAPPGIRAGREAGSIAAWQFPIARRRRAFSPPAGCRPASCVTRRASPASRSPPRSSWRQPASRSTSRWWRPPPCSTTSTSLARAPRVSHTARSAPDA